MQVKLLKVKLHVSLGVCWLISYGAEVKWSVLGAGVFDSNNADTRGNIWTIKQLYRQSLQKLCLLSLKRYEQLEIC